MRHKFAATISCLLLSCALYAQWLPAVYFPQNSNFCDNTPWKLILYDDFNGSQLDTNQWITYYSWDGMPPGYDNDNLINARYTGLTGDNFAYNTVLKDENIVISNGTCKLLVKNEPANWHCISCPDTHATRYYTAAMLATPFHKRIGGANFFNNGMFEVRMKMPANKLHTTVWTWHGSDWDGSQEYGVDEIDMAESGLSSNPSNPWGMVNNYNLHAWGPENPLDNNPNHLPHDATIGGAYPRQNWWNLFLHNYYDFRAWHTYTCAWDTASIALSLDGSLVKTFWKYYTKASWFGYQIYIGSGCIGSRTGNYYITYGYPYNSAYPECNFRITTLLDGIQSESVPVSTSTILGQAEIDYVKIWQRHIVQAGHTEICAANTYPSPTISGPNEVCGQVSYTVSPAVTGGTWSSFNDSILYIGNPSSSGVDVAKDAGGAFNQGWVAYSYGNGVAACPLKTVYKRGLYCNRSTDWDVVMPTVLDNNGNVRIHFIADLYHKRDISGGTTPVVTWNVSITSGQDTHDDATAEQYTLQGQYASTPAIAAPRNGLYNIQWAMSVTDASGTWSRSGERNSKTALYRQEDDPNTYYINAYIDDLDDYDTTVYYGVAGQMVSEEEYADTLFMDEMIEKVRAEALEPYLITDNMESSLKGAAGFDTPGDDAMPPALKRKLKIYPNPVQSNITIIADSRFTDKQAVTVSVYDLAGKLIKSGQLAYSKGNIMTYSLSDIADGNYILELQQGPVNERIKITKAKQ